MSARHDRALLELAAQDEADILQRIRRGDRHAYGILYQRYVASARRVANAILRSSTDADDAVAEGFASAYAAIRRGKGPSDCFGPYLKSCVRHEAFRLQRKAGRSTLTPPDELDDGGSTDEFERLDERRVVERAFESLSPRMRTVLWFSEVEGRSHGEIADMTGGSSNGVAALAMRARRELGTKYLQAHVGSPGAAPAECHEVRAKLADIVRGSASRRVSAKTAAHLASCPDCASAQTELVAVNSRLRSTSLASLLSGIGAPAISQFGWTARIVSLLSIPTAKLTAVTALAVLGAVGPAPAPVVPPTDAPAPATRSHGTLDLRAPEAVVPATDQPTPPVAPPQVPLGEDPAGADGGADPGGQPGQPSDFEPPAGPDGPAATTAPPLGATTPSTLPPATGVDPDDPGTSGIPPVTVPPPVDVDVDVDVDIDLDPGGTTVELDTPGVNEVLPVDVTLPLPPVNVSVTVPTVPAIPTPVITLPPVDLGGGATVGAGPTGVSTDVDLAGTSVDVDVDLDDGIDVEVGLPPICLPLPGRTC